MIASVSGTLSRKTEPRPGFGRHVDAPADLFAAPSARRPCPTPRPEMLVTSSLVDSPGRNIRSSACVGAERGAVLGGEHAARDRLLDESLGIDAAPVVGELDVDASAFVEGPERQACPRAGLPGRDASSGARCRGRRRCGRGAGADRAAPRSPPCRRRSSSPSISILICLPSGGGEVAHDPAELAGDRSRPVGGGPASRPPAARWSRAGAGGTGATSGPSSSVAADSPNWLRVSTSSPTRSMSLSRTATSTRTVVSDAAAARRGRCRLLGSSTRRASAARPPAARARWRVERGDDAGVVVVALRARRLDQVEDPPDGVDEREERGRDRRRRGASSPVAQRAEQVLAGVGERLQVVEPEEAARALDRVDRPEHLRQELRDPTG